MRSSSEAGMLCVLGVMKDARVAGGESVMALIDDDDVSKRAVLSREQRGDASDLHFRKRAHEVLSDFAADHSDVRLSDPEALQVRIGLGNDLTPVRDH